MTLTLFLRIAALILFIIAVLLLFVTVDQDLYKGLIAAGLACWVASTIAVPAP